MYAVAGRTYEKNRRVRTRVDSRETGTWFVSPVGERGAGAGGPVKWGAWAWWEDVGSWTCKVGGRTGGALGHDGRS